MKNMTKLALVSVAASALATSALAATTTISNAPTGGSLSTFGVPDSQTYGQVFTAPVTGTLTSFTLYLNGGVGGLTGAVGTWNGTATHGFGFGSPTTLYQSVVVPSASAGAYTFTPNVAVTAGSRYVAYLSVFGVTQANTATSMPLGDNSNPYIDYMVWNNTSDPNGNASWNYFFNTGDAQFSATFAVPEPQSWAMMIAGFGLVGAAMRRRRLAAAG